MTIQSKSKGGRPRSNPDVYRKHPVRFSPEERQKALDFGIPEGMTFSSFVRFCVNEYIERGECNAKR